MRPYGALQVEIVNEGLPTDASLRPMVGLGEVLFVVGRGSYPKRLNWQLSQRFRVHRHHTPTYLDSIIDRTARLVTVDASTTYGR